MADTVEQKIKVSAGLTGRVVTLLESEAKRNGISFADQLRRATDFWADHVLKLNEPGRERVVVLDRASGQLLRTS